MMKSRIAGILGFACVIAACASTHVAVADDKAFADQMKKYLESAEGQKAVGSTVEKYFQNRQQEAAKEQEEKAAAAMENQFKNPVKVDVGTSPVRGPASAKVTIVEFSDFQCPFCKRGYSTMEQVMKMYPNDVKVVFKNKPLPMHPEAEPSAKAALAAGKQGKFWEMHDALFNNQDKLAGPFYEEQAKKLGLDIEKFKKDMASPEVAKAVEDDSKLADSLGVQGTPNFFVNGVAVQGAYPADYFKKIVDRWLTGKK